MTFDEIIEGLQEGRTYAREGWKDKDLSLGCIFNPIRGRSDYPIFVLMVPNEETEDPDDVKILAWQTVQEDRNQEDWYEIE